MPVAGLCKFLFYDIADQKNLTSPKEITDHEGCQCRDKYHGNTTDDARECQGKHYLEKYLDRTGTKIPGGIDHVFINLCKGIINRQYHKRQEIIYHAKDDGLRRIDDI